MKTSHANDNPEMEPTADTCHVWQTRLGRELSQEEARQTFANAIGFFSILAGWSKAEIRPANDPRKADVAQSQGEYDDFQ